MEKIDASYVNPFVMGAFSVLAAFLGETPTRGNPSAEATGKTSHGVNVVIGVTGQAHGHILLGMSLATADKLASRMLGQPVRTFDGMAASAVSELTNMICGAALSQLASEGRICDITPPTIIKGQKVQISTLSIPALVIPMELSVGELALTIALKGSSRALAA